MISSLDIYQDNGVKIIDQNDFTFISGSKYSGKSYLLRFLIKQKWQSGSSCLIVTSDAAQGNLLQKHLGIYDLNKYSILLNDSTENQKKNFTKIKALQNEEKIEISKHDINSNSLIEQNILARISAYYNNLNQPLIQGKSFSELLTISAFDTNSYTNIHFNQIFDSGKFDFSEKEFTEVSQKVKTAYELQLKGENKNDVYFSRKAYTEKTAERSWALIVHWLENSRIKILKSIELLSVLLNKQVNSIFELEWKELQQELGNADHYLLDCTSFLMQYKDFTPKTSLFGIDKKAKETNDKYLLAKQKIIYDYKKLINSLSSNNKIKDNYLLPDPECNNIEEIKRNLTEILRCNDKFETILYDSIKKEVKSLNFRNIRNSYTENLQNELKILFTVLNEGYAFKKWEDTAFSINKQIHFLENILEDLNEIEGQKLNFFNNYNWNSFLIVLR